jgi:MFS family permease
LFANAAIPHRADKISELNWIISAFNLTAATFIPFWAQLADIFGRFYSLMATIVVMAVGSAICTGAPTSSFSVLLLGRALQGMGAAGINTLVRTILADRVSLKVFTTNWTIFMIVAAVSFSVGPVIGGYITKVSWRWCFGINLPVVVVAIISVFFLLRKLLVGPQPLPQHEGRDFARRSHRLLARLATIDYIGQLLFLFGLGLLTLAFTWAGGSYPWTSAQVLAPLVLGAILTPAWLAYEYLLAPGNMMARLFPSQKPMIPWELISQRDMGLLFIINFVVGMCMFSIMYFMDLYFALVEHKSSSQSGLALLYYLPGLGGKSSPPF